MASLLIDFDNIIKSSKLSLLETRIKPIPETKFSLGLVLVVPQDDITALETIPKGKERVQYLNSFNFVKNISGYSYLIYDKKKKVCEIIGMKGSILPKVMESVLSSIPNDVTLWIGVSLDDPNLHLLIHDYVISGFHDPYICTTSPLGFTFNDYSLCMLRQNDIIDNNAINDIKYVLSQFLTEREGHCTLTAKLSNTSIKYMQQLSKIGSTLNKDGVITQKEIAGKMITGQISKDLVHDLEVDRNSIVSGEEEGVEVIGGLYNFHSHPLEAYKRHNVKLGWPSAQDYIGFLSSCIKFDTILHIVVSIEGFYVISLSNYWVNKKDKLDNSVITFVSEKYDIGYKKGQTSIWYVHTVNKIAYEGYPVFLVQYFPWYKANDTFIIPYHKNGVNCFARQSTTEKFNYLY